MYMLANIFEPDNEFFLLQDKFHPSRIRSNLFVGYASVDLGSSRTTGAIIFPFGESDLIIKVYDSGI